MNLSDLLEKYANRPYIHNIVRLQKEKNGHKIQLEGLKGSLKALVGAATYKNHASTHLYILNDRESAEYFQNDLQTFLDKKQVWFYLSPFKRETDFGEADNWAVLQRTEVLSHLQESRVHSHVIITYPEALFEKVVNPNTIKENTFEVRVGDKLDMDFLIEFFVQYHFERTDFVYEAGNFSIRGGIVDIFSYSSDLPYRIELGEDDVESIRMFDPATQLSVKKMNHISIVPNLEQQHGAEERISFIDYLPDDTLIFAQDIPYVEEVIASMADNIGNYLKSVKEIPQHLQTASFLKPGELSANLIPYTVVEFGTRFHFKPTSEYKLDINPQPEFNKNFNLLADNLKKNDAHKFTNLIFSDQPKQVERIYAIFEDLKVKVDFIPIYKTLHEGFIDNDIKFAVYTEHQIFGRYQRYRGKRGYTKSESLTLKELYEMKPGDFVTHIDHGVGIFSGLEKIDTNGQIQEAIRLKYKGGDLLYVNIHSLHKIARYVGQEGHPPKMNKLGTNTWENLKNKTKKQVKDIARDLIKLYAKRKAQKGFAFSPDNYMQTELEASFIYEDTPDQAKTTEDVKKDMQSGSPMDRLVCGDVGFGKTEIAVRAAFKAAVDGKQSAILVPTTVLALQHFKTFKDRLKDFPVTVDFISRFKTAQQQKVVLQKVEEGKVDILIGTHRILSKDLKFKDLGLLIIDEEQKFGVAAKEKLRVFRANVDTLTLTATPIPRTLSFSLMGARDLSIINTPPPNRQPVDTRIAVFNKEMVREALEKEIIRGGQVFYVHNRIKDIFEIGDMIMNLVPHAKVAVAHAQMEPKKLEEIMLAFIDGHYDVLVSTNIVESGLDIPNANTIIIDNAQNFGLSDLYQLRGRVGRSNRKAYCILLTPPLSVLTPDARKRLAALEEYTDLGSGFHIAMKDMDIRGAGNLLGAEQSGFIAEIGLEMYQKILNEAMRELKHDEFKDLFADQLDEPFQETQLETDLELLLPDRYVSNVNERLILYTKINDLENEEQIAAFSQELEDRFGIIPRQTRELLNTVRVKWLAKKLCIEKLTLKRNRMKAEFSVRAGDKFYQGAEFGRVIEFITKYHSRGKLNQKPNGIEWIVSDVTTATTALDLLRKIAGEEVGE